MKTTLLDSKTSTIAHSKRRRTRTSSRKLGQPKEQIILHAFRIGDYTGLLIRTVLKTKVLLSITFNSGGDGKSFPGKKQNIKVFRDDNTLISPALIQSATLSSPNSRLYLLSFTLKQAGRPNTYVASSPNLIHWRVIGKIPIKTNRAFIVHSTNPRHAYAAILSLDDGSVCIAYSKNLSQFEFVASPLLQSRSGEFDNQNLSLVAVFSESSTFHCVYTSADPNASRACITFGFVSFDTYDPQKLLFRSKSPIHEIISANKSFQIVGGFFDRQNCTIYLQELSDYLLKAFSFVSPITSIKGEQGLLSRSFKNPIIKPQASSEWESVATFNPAVFFDGTKTHILYRAVGTDGRSVLGYASSYDGVNITERLPHPVYVPHYDFESYGRSRPLNPSPLASGPGWGGCEDPKITQIGDRLYLTYVAFDGWNSINVALTSIKIENFLKQKWTWEKPQIMSQPIRSRRDGVLSNIKSACLLPEKINDQFVVFFRVFPDICIDYRNELKFSGGKWLKIDETIPTRSESWDGLKISIGAPPIKTKAGWLVFYSGVDHRDTRYKMGVMLLSLTDPKVVLYRSNAPVLAPDEWYENEGKAGIIYPCGATLQGDILRVYYGGGDSVVCVASCSLEKLLSHLKTQTEQTFSLHTIHLA